MARGRPFEQDWSIDYVRQLLIEKFGIVKHVAKELQIGPVKMYDLLDEYPELREARKIGLARKHDYKIETCEEVLQKLIDQVDIEPERAAKQAQFVLKNLKGSPYNNHENIANSLASEIESARNLTKGVMKQVESHIDRITEDDDVEQENELNVIDD